MAKANSSLKHVADLPIGTADGVRILFENANDALFVAIVDAAGGFRFEVANQAFLNLARPELSGAHGREPHEVLPWSAAAMLVKGMRSCCASRQPVSLQLDLPAKGRSARWQFRLIPVSSPASDVERILGQGKDNSEQLAQTARLERSHRLLERIAETTRDLVYVFDRVEQRNVYMNRHAYSIIGYRPHELREMKGDILARLVHEQDLPRLLEHYRAFDGHPAGHVATIEFRVRHANGHYVWLASRDTILSSDRHAYARRIIGCAADVTQQRDMLRDLKTITQKVLDTQDQERRRIARELHDSTAQHLVAAAFGIGATEREIAALGIDKASKTSLRANLAEARHSLAEAQKEIRTLSYLLHPPEFDELGLVETLRRFVMGYSRRTGIRARLTVAKSFSCASPDIAIVLLRIAQESLVNVYRHAEATHTEVRLGILNGHYAIEIEDDGKGFPSHDGDDEDCNDSLDNLGVGIPGMRARVQQFQGRLYLLNGRRGALIRAAIPENRAVLQANMAQA